MKRLYTLISLLCLTPVWALDAQDQGYFTLNNVKTGKPSTVMHYTLHNGQWLMEGKDAREKNFTPVCGYSDDCRLRDASVQQVAQYKSFFSAETAQKLDIDNTPMECVANIAFAFCRIEKNSKRHYFWVAPLYETQRQPVVLPLYRQQLMPNNNH